MTEAYRYEGTDTSLVFYTDQEGTITEIHLMENLFWHSVKSRCGL